MFVVLQNVKYPQIKPYPFSYRKLSRDTDKNKFYGPKRVPFSVNQVPNFLIEIKNLILDLKILPMISFFTYVQLHDSSVKTIHKMNSSILENSQRQLTLYTLQRLAQYKLTHARYMRKLETSYRCQQCRLVKIQKPHIKRHRVVL